MRFHGSDQVISGKSRVVEGKADECVEDDAESANPNTFFDIFQRPLPDSIGLGGGWQSSRVECEEYGEGWKEKEKRRR